MADNFDPPLWSRRGTDEQHRRNLRRAAIARLALRRRAKLATAPTPPPKPGTPRP